MNVTVAGMLRAASLACLPATAAGQTLPASDGQWALSDKGAAIERADGRDVLAFETGSGGLLELHRLLERSAGFRGEASYSFDAPRREGLIRYDQARLWLPLVAGDNRARGGGERHVRRLGFDGPVPGLRRDRGRGPLEGLTGRR